MRPEEKILPKKGLNGAVTLIGRGDVNIALIATTVEASVVPDKSLRYTSSITFYPESQKGLIAIRVVWGKNEYNDFILDVTRGKSSEIDLHTPWYPSNERMGQNIGSNVEVNINSEIFTTDPHAKGDIHGNMDGNLLLAYLNEDIPAQAVIDVAQEIEDEVSAREQLADAKNQFSVQGGLLDRAVDDLMKKETELKELKLDMTILEGEKLTVIQELEDEKSKKVDCEHIITRALTHVDNEFGARKQSLNTVRRILTGDSKPETTLQ